MGGDAAAPPSPGSTPGSLSESPLLPLKMSTALLKAPDYAQRISIHLQHLKARLLPRNTCPPDSHITQSCNINNSKHNNIRTACLAACEYGQSLVRQ